MLLTIHNLIYSQLKEITNRNVRRKEIASWIGKHCRSIDLEREMSGGLI